MTDVPAPPVPPGGVEPRRRLHPLSPLLHSAKVIAGIVAAISWQGYAQLGLGPWAGLITVFLVGAVAFSVVGWYMTGYHVVGRELRVYEGVLRRRTRAIPLERLQSVEVVRSLLAQLTGLAELRLEVVGGAKTEAPLAYLTLRDAGLLRDRLLALAGRLGTPVGAVPAAAGAPVLTVDAPAGRPLHAVDNRDVMLGQLLTPQVWALPVALAFVVLQAVMEQSWGFVGVASTLTALAGIVFQPVRRVLEDWNFRLGRDDSGLRVRHGLLETRSQVVPVDRVQSVRATWPLFWRPKGWLRMRMDVAGLALPDGQKGGPADNLLPVGDEETARRLLPEVLPGAAELIGLPLPPPPRRARWLAPLAQPRLGALLTGDLFAARSGVLTRRLALVPYARIQSVRIVQGPVQRLLGLATVYADTAAGNAAAEHRDLAEARTFAALLTDRARRARA